MFDNHSHVRYAFINMKKLVKKLARIEGSSICRQLFANVFADCSRAIHTHQLEFAYFSLPCEGRLGCGHGKSGLPRRAGSGRESKCLLPFPFLPRIPFVADPARLPPALSIVLTDREPALLLDIVSGARSLGQRLNKRNTDFNTLC